MQKIGVLITIRGMKNLKLILTCLIFILSSIRIFAQEIIPMSDIKEGMKGIGYTIVKGTNIEPFDVEVVSILKKSWHGSDAILIRLSGLNLEHSGTVAGMSGSPIYFDGKLAGALSFGWSFAKDPIAGVTPIEEMYKLYDDTNTSPRGISTAQNALKTPLLFSGFNNSFSQYKDEFSKMGFYPIQTGGSVGDDSKATNFSFGDSAAIVLVDGDLSIAGIGTVSHTDSNRFLLFGHSMFGKGALKAPVSRAYINSVIASTAISFKLGSASSNYLGYTTYDGAFGISGVYNELPTNLMIPVELDIEDTTFLSKKMNFRVLNDGTYFPMLFKQALGEALMASAGSAEEGVFSISYEIYTDYFDEPYTITNRIISYSSDDAYKALIDTVVSPVNFFTYNNFEKVGIKSIKMSVKRSNIEYAFIDSITLVESRAVAGERIHLRLAITEYGKGKKYITVPVDLPISLNAGVYTLFAGNEYMFNLAEHTYMPKKYVIRNLDDVMRLYSKSYDDKNLKVWLYSSSRGVSINGANYPNLPPSYYGILAKKNTSDKAAYITAIEGSTELPHAILGVLSINLLVQGAKNYENN